MTTLAEAVQGLPAELYNNILDFVLTPNDNVVTIEKGEYLQVFSIVDTLLLTCQVDYKPPAQMRISHATRTYFATNYYTKTVFHVKGDRTLNIWLTSISDNDIKKIRAIHFEEDEAEVKSMQTILERLSLQAASEDLATAVHVLLTLNHDLRKKLASFKTVLHCKVEGEEGEGWHKAGEILDRGGFVTSAQ